MIDRAAQSSSFSAPCRNDHEKLTPKILELIFDLIIMNLHFFKYLASQSGVQEADRKLDRSGSKEVRFSKR